MKVIGFGDNVVDEYVNKKVYYPGGNAYNFAAYSKMLGIDSAYLGIFGNDEAGKHVVSIAKTIGVDISRCRIMDGENGHAYVELKDGDRRFIGSNRGGVARERPIVLSEDDLVYLSSFDLICSSINSHVFTELEKVHKLNVFFAFDFSVVRKEEVLQSICPMIDFAFISCGGLEYEDAVKDMGLLHSYGVNRVLATRGIKGSLFSDSTRVYSCPASEVDAIDTLGAGDAFLASFLTSYVRLMSEESMNEDRVVHALEAASEFSAKICLINGAFGYGKRL